MAWSTPRTWVAGEVPTAGYFNDVRDQLNFLYSLSHSGAAGRVPGALWPTTSAAFTDWNGGSPCSTSFTKRGDAVDSVLWITIHTKGYVSSQPATVQFAVNVGGTDWYNAAIGHHFNAANDHRHMTEVVGASAAAGTHTIKLRVLVQGGVTFNVDTNDFAQLIINEVSL